MSLVFIVIVSCSRNNNDNSVCCELDRTIGSEDSNKSLEDKMKLNDSIEKVFLSVGLVDITSVNSRIKVDLRYATSNNFMNTMLYDTLKSAYFQKEVAERLSKCQDLLDSIRPGFCLLIFDGARPLQVQQEMWDALDSIPRHRRGKFVSNPVLGSVHNFGAAVDLTIVNIKGEELDMGAGYDDFREIAFPKLESQFLKSGELTQKQVDNRKLLRRVMSSQNFSNIPSEWWHFNAFSRITTSHKFEMLVNESGATKWFRIVPKKDSLIVDEQKLIEN